MDGAIYRMMLEENVLRPWWGFTFQQSNVDKALWTAYRVWPLEGGLIIIQFDCSLQLQKKRQGRKLSKDVAPCVRVFYLHSITMLNGPKPSWRTARRMGENYLGVERWASKMFWGLLWCLKIFFHHLQSNNENGFISFSSPFQFQTANGTRLLVSFHLQGFLSPRAKTRVI